MYERNITDLVRQLASLLLNHTYTVTYPPVLLSIPPDHIQIFPFVHPSRPAELVSQSVSRPALSACCVCSFLFRSFARSGLPASRVAFRHTSSPVIRKLKLATRTCADYTTLRLHESNLAVRIKKNRGGSLTNFLLLVLLHCTALHCTSQGPSSAACM